MPCFILLACLVHSCISGIRNKFAIRLPHLLRNNTFNLESEAEFPVSRQQPTDVSNLLVDNHHSLLLFWLSRHWSTYLWILLPKRDEPLLYWNHRTYVCPKHPISDSTYLYSVLLTVCAANSVNIKKKIGLIH